MSKIERIRRWIKSPRSFIVSILGRRVCRMIPDKMYVSLKYWAIMGRWPNINKPTYMSEKIQWLKLNNRDDRLPIMVDKYAVREHIKNVLGEEYLIPIYGVWEKAEDINWEELPEKFVLKCNHGSHTNIICTNKSELNITEATNQLNKWLRDEDTYYYGREWPYKEVTPQIICEQFIESDSPGGIIDYKFLCFNGQVDNVMICSNRQTGNVSFDHFDKEWNFLRYQYVDDKKPDNYTINRPEGMSKMWEMAEILSKEFPFVRVDLYYERNRIYFGELTFFPQSGYDTDLKKETDLYLGKKINFV